MSTSQKFLPIICSAGKNCFTSWQGLDEPSLDDGGHKSREPRVGLQHLDDISGRDELQQDWSSIATSSFELAGPSATFRGFWNLGIWLQL